MNIFDKGFRAKSQRKNLLEEKYLNILNPNSVLTLKWLFDFYWWNQNSFSILQQNFVYKGKTLQCLEAKFSVKWNSGKHSSAYLNPFLFTKLICKNEVLVFHGSVHNSPPFQKLASEEVNGTKGMRIFPRNRKTEEGNKYYLKNASQLLLK